MLDPWYGDPAGEERAKRRKGFLRTWGLVMLAAALAAFAVPQIMGWIGALRDSDALVESPFPSSFTDADVPRILRSIEASRAADPAESRALPFPDVKEGAELGKAVKTEGGVEKRYRIVREGNSVRIEVVGVRTEEGSQPPAGRAAPK